MSNEIMFIDDLHTAVDFVRQRNQEMVKDFTQVIEQSLIDYIHACKVEPHRIASIFSNKRGVIYLGKDYKDLNEDIFALYFLMKDVEGKLDEFLDIFIVDFSAGKITAPRCEKLILH